MTFIANELVRPNPIQVDGAKYGENRRRNADAIMREKQTDTPTQMEKTTCASRHIIKYVYYTNRLRGVLLILE